MLRGVGLGAGYFSRFHYEAWSRIPEVRIVATCDRAINPLCFDAQYLYLLLASRRRLFVFNIEDRPMRPFGMVTFDPVGKAKPPKLPAVHPEE